MTATPWTLPSGDVIDPKLPHAVETFHRAADEVAAVLRANTDWGASGRRDGQYAVDLDADAACLDVLYRAGYMKDPAKRGPGFGIGFLATLGLVGTALWGVIASL